MSRFDMPRFATPSKPYHHGNLADSLLDAADRLLNERADRALTLRDIAKTAGVSHAAPYHHFAGLDDLLAALAARAFDQLAGAMERAAQDGDGRQRLLAICEAYVAFATRKPAQFRLMFGPMLAQKSHYPHFAQAAERAFAVLLGAANDFDNGRGAELALSGWSLAHGLAHLQIDGAFAGLPIAVPKSRQIARTLAAHLLT